MPEQYKIYIGDYKEQGTPPTWTIVGRTPKIHLRKQVKELLGIVHQGMEIYIVTPKNEIKAVFRDGLEKYFKKDIIK